MSIQGVNINLLKDSFDKRKIDTIRYIVNEYVSKGDGIINKKYFQELGSYTKRNDDTVDINLSNYFSRLLYAPNFAILDYVIKNINQLKDLKFIDNGAGLGILSIFLKTLNIDCYNYDNFSQIKDVTFHENVLNKMNIKIHPVSSQIPNDCEVLVCSGIWIDNPEFLKRNLQYVLLDRNHEDKGIGPELTSEFTLLDKYNTINVYGRK